MPIVPLAVGRDGASYCVGLGGVVPVGVAPVAGTGAGTAAGIGGITTPPIHLAGPPLRIDPKAPMIKSPLSPPTSVPLPDPPPP